ncbi:MAG: APC family permease [Alphaproteobacteria bacterium]|nr:APC family permease [Alphaproteobacteria bacterium]
MSNDDVELKRSLNFPLLTLYGVGTIIGAGIFVLIGKVAGVAGMQGPLAFLMAAVLAGISAFSFAELSSRFPYSAGEAFYVREAFGRNDLALAVGLGVVLAGIISAGTIVNGFVGYFREFADLPDWLIIIALSLLLGAIAIWGIMESVSIAAVITIAEVGVLVVIAWAGRGALSELPARAGELWPGADFGLWLGICSGAVLAFYAFIGFEDMVNVAEEVHDVRRTLPLAILTALVFTGLCYVVIALVAVFAAPSAELAASEAPLAFIYERTTGRPSEWVSAVSIVSVLNGALIQVIMASRVLYGLARQGSLPHVLGRVHPRFRTPVIATGLVTGLLLVLALAFPIETLARLTSLVTLSVFAMINLALVAIKRQVAAGIHSTPTAITVPMWVPVLGAVISIGFAVFQLIGFAAGGHGA